MFSLKNKVALVTGASQGIGRDAALALAEAGDVCVIDIRSDAFSFGLAAGAKVGLIRFAKAMA